MTEIEDPYSWLEKLDDPRVLEFVKRENERTRAFLGDLPNKLYPRIAEYYMKPYLIMANITKKGIFTLIREGKSRRIYLLNERGERQLIVDSANLGKDAVLKFFYTSDDGKYLAFSYSIGGSDVGFIKIIRTERIQDGVERLVFAAGPAALPYIQEEWLQLRRISEKIGTPLEFLEKKLEELLGELKDLRRTVRRLLGYAAKLRAQELREMPELRIRGVRFYATCELESDQEYVLKISDNLLGEEDAECFIAVYGEDKPRLLIIANRKAIDLGIHAGRLAAKLAERLGGRGGGRERLGQGGVARRPTIDELRKIVSEIVSGI